MENSFFLKNTVLYNETEMRGGSVVGREGLVALPRQRSFSAGQSLKIYSHQRVSYPVACYGF